MVWVRLPKSGRPMWFAGSAPKGLAEIPDPDKPKPPAKAAEKPAAEKPK